MRSLAWKLTALAAVIGVGCLVMLQAQRGMNQSALSKAGTDAPENTAKTAAADANSSNPQPAAADAPSTNTAGNSPVNPPGAKGMPELADAPHQPTAPVENFGKPIPSPNAASVPAPVPNAVSSGGPKPADAGSLTASDPFAEGDAPKHSPATGPADRAKPVLPVDTKPTLIAADGKPAKRTAEITQAAGTADRNAIDLNFDDMDTKSKSTLKGNGKDPAALSAAGKSPPNDAKGNGNAQKTDPPLAPQSEPAPDDKNSAGPQLLVPGGGPDLTPALGEPPATPPKSTNDKTIATPPAKGADPNHPTGDGASSGGGPPALFADLDNPAAPLPAKTKSVELAPRGGDAKASSSPKGNADLSSLDLPLAAGKDGATPAPAGALPGSLPNGAPAGQAEGAPKTPAVPDRISSNGASQEPASSPGRPELFPSDPGKELPIPKKPDAVTQGTDAPRRDTPAAHSETRQDFQGEGTIGEAAPLGPQRPQLSIEKVAPQNALLGQPLVYSIFVKNLGTSEARDVVVEDPIPKGTKLSGTIPRAELTGKKLTWRLGTIASGDQRKISVRVVPLEAGEIGSMATVSFVAQAAAGTVVTAPRLEFELSAPPSARLGELVPFHFKVHNVGTGEARGVVIRELIPEGLSHSAGNDLEYEIGRLAPGKSKELTLELKAAKVGSTLNRAVVTGEGGLSVEAKTTIEISGSKVALSRTGPARRYLGRPAVYGNTIVNESKFAVENVMVVESVPAGMEFYGATHGGQYNDGTRTIAWRIDHMAPGETYIVKSKLIPKTPGSQIGSVRVTVPNGQAVETTSETKVDGFAALGVDVPAIESPVDVGEKVTLRVNARNKGTLAATNVVVTVEIPDEMTVVSARGPGMHVQQGNRVRFGPLSALEGQTAAACEIVLQTRKRGDTRLRVVVQADQMEKPLVREESVLILSESPEPTAAR